MEWGGGNDKLGLVYVEFKEQIHVYLETFSRQLEAYKWNFKERYMVEVKNLERI